jgi:hypothetical protein
MHRLAGHSALTSVLHGYADADAYFAQQQAAIDVKDLEHWSKDHQDQVRSNQDVLECVRHFIIALKTQTCEGANSE